MSPSNELNIVLDMIRKRTEEIRITTDDERLSYERVMANLLVDDDISTSRVGANGVPSEWISAPESASDRVILYLHGGGYMMGSVRTHRALVAHLARASKSIVLALDYRLAPESRFPSPVEDAVSGYRWLLSQGIAPEKLSIVGDSAGGGLVISTLVALKNVGEPLPSAGVCISPWVDMEASGESYISNAEADPSVSRTRILKMAETYMGGKNPKAPLASPIYADLSGLPPLLIQVGGIEVLLDDSNMLKIASEAADVSVVMEIWEHMPHVWHHYAPILPEARQAIGNIGAFLLSLTG